MKRQSGVLLPVFSLPGRYGCGTFGEAAHRWIDILKEGGFSCWQVLPFSVPDDYNSPYMSYSSFGGNPYFIDFDLLKKEHSLHITDSFEPIHSIQLSILNFGIYFLIPNP